MVSYVTETGLVVTDRRYSRADPLPPRDNEPNDNVQPPPPVSVGPNASEGFGNTHVMYPAGSVVPQAWSGWPVEWATPMWGSMVGLNEVLQRVSTVWTCLDLNSSVLASMPPYRTQGDTLIDPLPWMINPQPEVYTDWTEAMKQVVISYQLGEAFLWATSRYADRTVKTWVMLNPSWVTIEMSGQLRRYSMMGVDITDDVLHIRYVSWPGDPHGHGALEAAASTLFGAAALERYAANLAVRGGIPWATLTAPGNLDEAQATTLRERFVLARMSAMGAPAVLSGGVKLDALTINPKDMALLELRQFAESRLAVLLGVPPTLVGLPTGDGSLTYRNAEGIYDYHWRSSLRTKAGALMGAISLWALVSTQRIEVNRDEYVRPAFNERTQGYATLFNIYDPETGERAMTIPEIRAAERLDTGGNTKPSTTSLSVA
jgi:HK97 family phage portal protein